MQQGATSTENPRKGTTTISFPELRSPWPAVGKQELWEHPFSNNNENNRILHIRFHCAVHSLHLWYLWRMPEMDAPRALVFRPLVKGYVALGTRLAQQLSKCTATVNVKQNMPSLPPCFWQLVDSKPLAERPVPDHVPSPPTLGLEPLARSGFTWTQSQEET